MQLDPGTLNFPPPHVPVRDDWLSSRQEPVLDPEQPIVDAHHHLWHRPHERYTPDDLERDLGDGHRILTTVYVQARTMYDVDAAEAFRPVGETRFVNAVADAACKRGRRVADGIVCMADLMLGDAVSEVLDAHVAAAPTRLRGVRNMTAHDPHLKSSFGSPPAGRLMDPKFRQGFACLEHFGLAADIYAFHPQLDEVADLASRFPATTIVLDHLGGPLGSGPYADRRDAVFREWSAAIRRLAENRNVVMKLGGVGMHQLGFGFHKRAEPPSSEEIAAAIKPYVAACLEAFGPARCICESNFPVDKSAFSYRVIWNAFKRLAAELSADDRNAILATTAMRVYRLDGVLPA